jgi:hypothetical protein
MHIALRRFHPSPLSMVFVVSLTVLLIAIVIAVIGVIELVAVESYGATDVLPFARRLF